jgi:hypothetical protein
MCVRYLSQIGLTYTFPDRGSITDLEEMTLQSKLSFLKGHRDWKCMNKNEVLDEHKDTWQHNGLSNLRYEEIARRPLDPSGRAIKVKVDIRENGHWTDLVCGVDDTQLDTPVEVLKARYSEMQAKKDRPPSGAAAMAVSQVSSSSSAAGGGGGGAAEHHRGTSTVSGSGTSVSSSSVTSNSNSTSTSTSSVGRMGSS